MRSRVLVLALLAAGCHKGSHAADAGPPPRSPDLPAQIDVTPNRSDIIYSWQDEDGTFHDTQKWQDVPQAFRKHVLVRDLALKPEEVHSDEYMYVADLTDRDPDGGFPYAVVSRYHFELPRVFDDGDGGYSEANVIIYGTSWCGACAEARKYFDSKHVPYLDKDIEKDGAAAQELARKAKRAGIQPRGVPVIDVRGTLLEGFSAQAVEQALHGT